MDWYMVVLGFALFALGSGLVLGFFLPQDVILGVIVYIGSFILIVLGILFATWGLKKKK